MNNRIFDTDIYEKQAIEQSIVDFKNICRIETEINNNQMTCSFFDCEYDVEITIKEFSNYVIDLMNSKRFV